MRDVAVGIGFIFTRTAKGLPDLWSGRFAIHIPQLTTAAAVPLLAGLLRQIVPNRTVQCQVWQGDVQLGQVGTGARVAALA